MLDRYSVPPIRVGDVITADWLNAIRDALPCEDFSVGQFKSKYLNVRALRRPAAASGGTIRLAITTVSIPAATGTSDGIVTPGIALDESDEPIDSAFLVEYGTNLGDPTTAGDAIRLENYSPTGPILSHKGVYVQERAAGAWEAISEFCSAYDVPDTSS